MTGVTCLAKNTQLQQDLKDIVEYIAYDRIGRGKDASLASVYNTIRKSGIEIDLQSVGYIYNETLDKSYQQIMSDQQVNDYMLKSFNDAIQRAALLEQRESKEKQIGEDAPEVYVTNGIMNMFYNSEMPNEDAQSDMLKMQNALWKGVQRKLKLPDIQKPKNNEQWKDILGKALGYEGLGMTDLNGRLNSIADLYNAMRDELNTAISEAKQQADPANFERLQEMVNGLESSTYSLLFSGKEARKLLDEVMKEAGFGKELKNGETILDWNKLAGGIGSIQDIRENVDTVLSDNGFSRDVIDGVKRSLENEFNELQGRILQKRMALLERESKKKAVSSQREFLQQSLRIEKLQDELIRVMFRRAKEKPQKGSKDDSKLSKEENELLSQIEAEQEKWDEEIKQAKQAKKEYKKLESERNRQLKTLNDLKDKLDQLKSGTYAPKTKGQAEKDVPEIEDFKAQVKAEMDLTTRERAIGRTIVQKSDLRRLAELNNLGIFESAHDRLLYDLLGVGELQQEDIHDLKQISQAASNLYREVDKNYGSEVFASRQFQSLQRLIDNIIARNINDKTKLLKALSVIKNFFDVYLTGLLAGPLTILENLWSGVKEMFVPTIMGAGINKQDAQLYWRMLADVTARGQSFGEEIGSFAPRELYVNSIEWKWKGATPKEKAESLLFALTIPARIGLLGFDSANKVTITNKTFKNAIYKSLTQQGMNKEDAKKIMNEALYGQSFEDAKQHARELMEKTNNDLPDKYKLAINNNTITTLANDLVKVNLNANGAITKEVLEAAYKSSYHVAGYGLGHEANNWVSRMIKGARESMRKEEERLAKEKDWDGLAVQRLKSTFVNNIIIRFTAGASNWLYLRAQSGLGIGLVTGFLGKWDKDIDFESKESIQQSIKDTQNARNKIGRALVGISVTALSYMIGYALYGGEDDEDKKKKLGELNNKLSELKKTNYRDFEGGAEEKAKKVSEIEEEISNMGAEISVMKRIKKDWMGSKLFKKVAPDVMLLHYYLDTEKSKLMGATKYVQNTYGIGDQFSTEARAGEVSKLAFKGDTDAALGQLSAIAGDKFGVPLWQAGKNWYKLGKWIGGGKVASDFKRPETFSDGIWGGGMLEDLGFYDRNPSITTLPGVGAKGYERFKEHGITNMNDLKKNKEWWSLTYTDENGNEKYILNATDRLKARTAAENYEKEK
jgi:hypothetical protein